MLPRLKAWWERRKKVQQVASYIEPAVSAGIPAQGKGEGAVVVAKTTEDLLAYYLRQREWCRQPSTQEFFKEIRERAAKTYAVLLQITDPKDYFEKGPLVIVKTQELDRVLSYPAQVEEHVKRYAHQLERENPSLQ